VAGGEAEIVACSRLNIEVSGEVILPFNELDWRLNEEVLELCEEI
jgi:hypothetical protein